MGFQLQAGQARIFITNEIFKAFFKTIGQGRAQGTRSKNSGKEERKSGNDMAQGDKKQVFKAKNLFSLREFFPFQ
jgi:hypothetical protein